MLSLNFPCVCVSGKGVVGLATVGRVSEDEADAPAKKGMWHYRE